MHSNGDRDVLDAADIVGEALDAGTEVIRHVVARRIRNVHDRGAGIDCCLDDADQEVLVGTACILCIELDVVHILLCILDAVDGTLDALVLRDAELLCEVLRRDAEAGVDAGALGGLQGLCGTVDILVDSAREAAYDAVIACEAADLLHGLEVARTRNREAGLDDIDMHADELLGNHKLLFRVHGCAGGLLAVAEGGVEDCNLAGHRMAPLVCGCTLIHKTPGPGNLAGVAESSM